MFEHNPAHLKKYRLTFNIHRLTFIFTYDSIHFTSNSPEGTFFRFQMILNFIFAHRQGDLSTKKH
jgi:hypothetical protein